ncbi:transposase [Candidatus Gottesmanbacteria bacterium]|nr:transposase [Candidatus Gottesmanbacteria bacterium]
MSSNRSIVLANQQIYHVFNRGVERRVVFTNKREYERMFTTLWFYRHAKPGATLSHYLHLPELIKPMFEEKLQTKPMGVSLLAYCLMPNHFHSMLRQEQEGGIRRFLANVTNSYTKYFNLRRHRVGPLFQGTFKAVRVETDEQFMHLTRYIHLNPVSSFLVDVDDLETYPWSSYKEYLSPSQDGLCRMDVVRSLMSLKGYRMFVADQADYAKHLETVTHLTEGWKSWKFPDLPKADSLMEQ